MPGSASNVPQRMETMPGRIAASPKTGEPQFEQKWRRSFGLDSYALKNERPFTITRSSDLASMFVANDDPVALRHMPQWQ